MLRVAVAGVGHLGQFHAEKFASIGNVKLTGVYDIDTARARQIADKLCVKAFQDYDTLLEEVDAVDIASTTTAHYELAKQALEAGKHVFIEKPITSELWQAEELVALARRKGLKIQVGHIERFNPVILRVEESIKDPVFIESHRLSMFQRRGTDVPVVLDLMIHDIDLILDFVRGNVSDIRASGVGILTPSIDIANARLEFDNGAIANVTSSRASLKQERKIRFFQRDAYFSLDFSAKHVTVVKKSADIMRYLPQILMGNADIKAENLVDVQNIDLTDFPKDALTLELESFAAAVIDNTPPLVDGEAGLRALKVALDIMQRIKSQPSTHI
ncbi:MAG TPA: Gfo/Idh/MocA family oxidoreductase [Candidatus Cloacimonadota bacterium]|jgi:predicted dehydrogenase|nr:Gfo/Idh/MocA family oxidoreductase [Candidatus Cloacimonadota bacterium]HOF59555.1 Gfo/Idh/MocA family oxidoreductase [Candidatus Cloacimonadota bacterium]HOR58732.1 Gfo/Idh/MocA family oxidoreductase [Candidatus Cloacimonadota bacterium]HPB08115.1 Gfo/Idh/MocA family oxidoreductase [Candidatus Cloacimonadota bacterium]HQL13945.1 Gfo/Idh/MocA family oxidoreductase [Candidatus Cloacimonadota bacterium]